MNFDLTDDQVALRDGIRSFCAGRFPMDRVRAGFDRSAADELAETGVFSLRSDGFSWADTALVFEELGRALVPGPLVWSHLAHGVVDGIVTGIEHATGAGTAMIEHLGVADAVVVLDDDGITRVDPDAFDDAEAIDWPLDPLTPVHRVDVLPDGEVVAGPDDAGCVADGRRAAHGRVLGRDGGGVRRRSRSRTHSIGISSTARSGRSRP